MAAGVPPPPLNSPSGSYYWLEWYTNLTQFLNGQNIPWSDLNFSQSDIGDIVTRYHNTLTHIQGGNASGTESPTGNAYHLMGYGYVDSAASNTSLPSGWTVTNPSAGVYTITHNLGLAVPDYQAGASSNNSGVIVLWCDNSNPNTLSVHLASTSNLATPTNGNFSFWIGKL